MGISIFWILDNSKSMWFSGKIEAAKYILQRVIYFVEREKGVLQFDISNTVVIFGETWDIFEFRTEDLNNKLLTSPSNNSNMEKFFIDMEEKITQIDKTASEILFVLLSDGYYSDSFNTKLNDLQKLSRKKLKKIAISIGNDLYFDTILSFVDNKIENVVSGTKIGFITTIILSRIKNEEVI